MLNEDIKILDEIIDENNNFLMRYARGNGRTISKECISMIEKRNEVLLRVKSVIKDLSNNKTTKNEAREKLGIPIIKIEMSDYRKLEEARNNILRGNDIESAALILERCVLDNYIIKGGRVNILKIAVRQILNFIEMAKNKGILEYIRENVSLKNELNKSNKIIDEMTDYIRVVTVDMKIPIGENLLWDNDEIKQTFERKVENASITNKKGMV